MSVQPIILVLEDSMDRVRWLRSKFPDCLISHAPTVEDFEKKQAEPHHLVIFDHDLDLSHYSGGGYADPHSLTGADAARLYNLTAPVLVWSMNPPGARHIVEILEDRKRLLEEPWLIVSLPFGHKDLYQAIRFLLCRP